MDVIRVCWLVAAVVTLFLGCSDCLSNDNIQITGPESFITDGSRNLTLTCLATDADPGTVYTWAPSNFTCVDYAQNSGTCTLIPRLDQDNTTIICAAISSQGQPSQARYTFNLKYPPHTAPAITTSRQGNVLVVGDAVTCTVQGGKPLVTAVHINCTHHARFTSTDNVTFGTSMSSSVIISTLQATDDNTMCYCWATWEPEPGLYTDTSQASFQIRYDIHITGPESFITDGSRSLTLTCLATDADAGTKYSWSPVTFSCINYTRNSGSCVTKPRLDQDNTTIFCTALSVSQGSLSRTNFTLNLKYPPQTPPVITSSTPDNFVYVGDTVTCTVQGGKPLVTAVQFNCTNQQLTSSDNITDSSSVSSSVTISTLPATEDNVTCYCCATWEPEPGLYTVTSQKSFQIGHKAEVRNFTINQHPHSDTVTEGDRSVNFICKASGRPTPTLHISLGSEQVAVSEHTSDISITSRTVLTYTIPRVNCDDKGNYTCTAQNRFTGVASASLQLHVKNCDATEDTPLAAIVGGVVGGILVLTTAAVVGVLIWMKRNPKYEKPLPRRERESDTYTGLQPPDNNTARQTTPGIANPQHHPGLDEADRPHSYIDVLPLDNTYDPLQMTGRQSTAVYTDLRPTGPGGRGIDADGYELTVVSSRR